MGAVVHLRPFKLHSSGWWDIIYGRSVIHLFIPSFIHRLFESSRVSPAGGGDMVLWVGETAVPSLGLVACWGDQGIKFPLAREWVGKLLVESYPFRHQSMI